MYLTNSTPTLTIPNVTPSNAGDYFVDAVNTAGSTRSATAHVVIPAIAIGVNFKAHPH